MYFSEKLTQVTPLRKIVLSQEGRSPANIDLIRASVAEESSRNYHKLGSVKLQNGVFYEKIPL